MAMHNLFAIPFPTFALDPLKGTHLSRNQTYLRSIKCGAERRDQVDQGHRLLIMNLK